MNISGRWRRVYLTGLRDLAPGTAVRKRRLDVPGAQGLPPLSGPTGRPDGAAAWFPGPERQRASLSVLRQHLPPPIRATALSPEGRRDVSQSASSRHQVRSGTGAHGQPCR